MPKIVVDGYVADGYVADGYDVANDNGNNRTQREAVNRPLLQQ